MAACQPRTQNPSSTSCSIVHRPAISPRLCFIMLSTYFARMSHSMFTTSPVRISRRFVFALVWGMIANSATPSRQRATVRLIPSTASDPFSATYRCNSAGMLTPSHQLSPRSANSFTRPTPSTCPCTKCPPSRASAESGSSRLTTSPGLASAKDVLCSVSSERSAQKKSLPISTAVRQQPFTAILDPIFKSESIWAAPANPIRNLPPAPVRFSDSILPRFSMIPVNISKISLDLEIRSKSPQGEVAQSSNLANVLRPVLRHRHRRGSQNFRSIEQNGFVHQSGLEHRAIQRASGLQNHTENLPPP